MGLDLLFYLWMPKYIIQSRTRRTSPINYQALKEAIRVHAPNAKVKAASPETESGSIDREKSRYGKAAHHSG